MAPSTPILDYAVKGKPTARESFRLVIITLFLALLGVAIGVAITFVPNLVPVYRSFALLRLYSIPAGIDLPADTIALNPSEVAAACKQIEKALNTPAFYQGVLRELSKSASISPVPTPDELSRSLTISHIPDTMLLRIEATDSSPDKAAAIATAAMDSAMMQYAGRAPRLMAIGVPEKPLRAVDRGKPLRVPAALLGGVCLPLVVWLMRRRKRIAR